MANKYKYKDKLMTINELMEFSVVCESALSSRLRGGWLVDEAVETPSGKAKNASLSKSSVDRTEKSRNTGLKYKNYGIMPSRFIGEPSIEMTPEIKKTPFLSRTIKHKKNIETNCDLCGGVVWRSHAQIRDYGHMPNKCAKCRAEEKKNLTKQ